MENNENKIVVDISRIVPINPLFLEKYNNLIDNDIYNFYNMKNFNEKFNNNYAGVIRDWEP